ncbi:hypothetical protein EUGRSUZ_A02429 [Eucalyptus grandis]|uniref:Uncharacterized protein n=3 Tax=Eucalyptus grandis TaxID=71139 RepID=A0A059DIJ7_EUCGR|nr:hypothetical protein EUGRSUZ_A02429 [Eucalyptus grandis]KAK3446802.1 hypothetical protein EUGRSUZ_A02429 [Eucalyptus grandis]
MQNTHVLFDEDYIMYWWRSELMEYEDGELSWFNTGVRVGVGIGDSITAVLSDHCDGDDHHHGGCCGVGVARHRGGRRCCPRAS